jgi:mono/diheme cytochrome c family protein
MPKLLFFTAAMVLAEISVARADASKGGMLAAQLCVGCHAIRPGQASPKPEALPFAIVAAKPDTNIFALRSFLRTPHWTPDKLSLKADDSEDIASYIMSLRPQW